MSNNTVTTPLEEKPLPAATPPPGKAETALPGHEFQAPAPKTPVERLAFTVEETAQSLGLSRISVYRLLERGLLKSSSALRTKVISRESILKFLRESAE